jgi:hypothetical protein
MRDNDTKLLEESYSQINENRPRIQQDIEEFMLAGSIDDTIAYLYHLVKDGLINEKDLLRYTILIYGHDMPEHLKTPREGGKFIPAHQRELEKWRQENRKRDNPRYG